MSTIKDKLVKELVTDLTDEDIQKLMTVIQLKIEKGESALDISLQLVTAAAETIYYGFPTMEHSEIIELAEDVTDMLIDRILAHSGKDNMTEVIPHDQLN